MKHNGNAHMLDIPAYILHAKDERGRSFREIENDLMEIFNVRKDHVTVQRWYEKHSRKPDELQQRETAVKHVATPETVAETPVLKTAENAILNAENAVSGVAPVLQSVSFWREWRDAFHPADILYYLAVSLAAVGIVQALHLPGYPVAVLFCSGAFIALHGIKTTRGWKRLPHFAIMSVIEAGSFTAHTVWANTALWDGVKGLPLDIWENKYRNDLGEIVHLYGGNDVSVPGTIAIGIASFMLACTIYVCWLAVQNSKPK